MKVKIVAGHIDRDRQRKKTYTAAEFEKMLNEKLEELEKNNQNITDLSVKLSGEIIVAVITYYT